MRRAAALISIASLVACTDRATFAGVETTEASPSESTGDPPAPSDPSTPSPTGASDPTDATTRNDDDDATTTIATTTNEDDGNTFITLTDGGALPFECDLFAQDCPPGEKCMPWSNDGSSAWNATRCSPIADDPGHDGDPCTVEDSPFSGIDTCDMGHLCWNVDENGEGTCEDFCTGTIDNATCDDDSEACAYGSVVSLCLTTCDPLLGCAAGWGCYPIADAWVCAPDQSGEGGAHGDPCEFVNACDPGHVCIGAAAFTACDGALTCCSAACNVLDENADAFCAALDPAQVCDPWYRPGNAPDGYEHVGVCASPL